MSLSLPSDSSGRHTAPVDEKEAAAGAFARSNPPSSSSRWDMLPPWISSNLRSRRSLKTLARCWLASWVCFVILLPDKSLRTLGNTAFFALLGSVFIPANMPIQIFVFSLSTLVIGVLLGWGFGAAAMRAALASRNQLLLKQTLQTEEQSVAGLANPDAMFQASIFEGIFLDTRSSIVFGCFLGFSSFLFALLRVYVPKLILMSIFASIAMDIYCSFGPLFPFAQYTILNSMLTSLACYVATGLVVIVLLFPETLNHAHLSSTSVLLGKMKSIIQMQDEVLNGVPANPAAASALSSKNITARDGMIAMFQQLSAQLKFINSEISWGKWNGDDIKALDKPMMMMVSRLSALSSFAKMVGHPMASPSEKVSLDGSVSESSGGAGGSGGVGDTPLLRQMQERFRSAEAEHGVGLSDVLPVLKNATAELREGCADSLTALQSLVECVNTKRYARDNVADAADKLRELEESCEHLRYAIGEFKETKRSLLVEPFQPMLQKTSPREDVPLRSLYIMYVFAANLMVVANAILSLVEAVAATARKRQRNHLWMPKGLRAIAKILTSKRDAVDQAMGMEENPPEEEDSRQKEDWSYKLDPDSLPPKNIVQRFANFIHTAYQWAKTAEARFVFKYVVVTIALWLPAVFKSSAHFYYVQKGIWALIMAQTTLSIYASDQMFNYAMRLLGTFIGAVYGLLNWYIGSADGNGSPYGMAASVAVFLVPLVFFRIFAPPHYLPAVMLAGATWVLVVGYSWIDGHLLVFGNAGIGWSIAWRRWVLVMIGCVASFIVMMFPPTSGRVAVRLRNASTISGLSYIYGHLMSAWIRDAEMSEGEENGLAGTSKSDWLPVFREKFLSAADQVRALRAQTAIAKWEGTTRGKWPFDDYMNLADVQSDMVANLALLGGALYELDDKTRIAFLHTTKVVNPYFISDVLSTFMLVSQSLRTGEPLHQAQYQNLLDRVHYHGDMSHPTFDNEDVKAAERLQSITSYEYIYYATAIVSVFQLLGNLHELRRITTRLCGEVQFEGFEQWRRKHESAVNAV
ncbi:hypothetical protein BKA93DRAFT_807068 [Sparassis latifolia]|uniref:ER transporter 6TM N-terminal domain-containing protein n=1 Tax=Sparassis crispa TaxID=139825 RepID=A0A401GQ65_9APHY|nr:hypothetical protein SCP_0603370 [Sparassis crispa]GBE84358.1 hypothetical protein SCP_0603370 [Sparassis crispa]